MQSLIKEIIYDLPQTIETNEQLAQDHPEWGWDDIAKRVGVLSRHIAKPHETAFDLALNACQRLCDKHPKLTEMIDTLIFCTQTPDYWLPSNAFLIHNALGFSNKVLAFDINLACSGFVYSLAIADSFIKSQRSEQILIITADTYSKYIHPNDRSARVLFGDGAAVTWLGKSNTTAGIKHIECGTYGKGFDAFIKPGGACRHPSDESTRKVITDKNGNQRTREHLHMDGMRVLSFVNTVVKEQIAAYLKKNDFTWTDFDVVVFHQASHLAIDALRRHLQIPAEKIFLNLESIGNTVSASIPIALKDALDSGKIQPGHRVFCCGFGVGFSWGCAVIDF